VRTASLLLCAQKSNTPLHWAAHNGHASVVTLLCERGADKEAKNNVRTRHHAHAAAHVGVHVTARVAAARLGHSGVGRDGGARARQHLRVFRLQFVAARPV
jgi:hypothetical protein